jgi:hypothetical protein
MGECRVVYGKKRKTNQCCLKNINTYVDGISIALNGCLSSKIIPNPRM